MYERATLLGLGGAVTPAGSAVILTAPVTSRPQTDREQVTRVPTRCFVSCAVYPRVKHNTRASPLTETSSRPVASNSDPPTPNR
jgi:hypothetical protein